MKTHLFEGKQLTLTEIYALVPALSRQTIRCRLRDGYTNRIDMLAKPIPIQKARDGSRLQDSLRVKR